MPTHVECALIETFRHFIFGRFIVIVSVIIETLTPDY